MKKLSIALVAFACFSLTGLTGCGGSGETKVIQDGGDSGISDADKQKMEQDMESGAGYSNQGSN
ncbi:hypothetical protein OAF83_00065 [Rubripirellula sp.]|jgi:hypothetical protein|nr:hypothetical protein [Rubripirellula sp.]MDB4749274.1 hypothetical protein [Rubripirellula sp.]